jgi:predicted acetyltransferase
MIVRRLRPDENAKCAAVGSIAYSSSADLTEASGNELDCEVFGAFLDDGETIAARIYPITYSSNYCGAYLPSVGIGGVATLPEYRRKGCVRAIFNEIFRIAPERGWATSFLYPFSYTYYRQFGYERVLQTKTIRVPASSLRGIERNTDAVLYNSKDMINDILRVYAEHADRYNIMFRRDAGTRAYSADPYKSKKWTYLWHNKEGRPSSLATVTADNGCLTVKELAYSDRAGLCGIIGFLRMFEGQVHEFRFTDLPVDSELDCILDSYSDSEYSLHNGAMGRVLLVETLLRFNKYPQDRGHFRLRVEDSLDYNRGVYEVEYAGGGCEIKKHADGAFDIAADIPSLSRIMLGCESFNAEKASYISGITLDNKADDFFRAFAGRSCCLLDRF